MENRIELRCSSLDRIWKCPAATLAPEIATIGDMEAARLGTAAHRELQRCVEENAPPDDSEINLLAVAYSVDASELGMLVWNGWRCWESLRPHFPMPMLERQWANEYVRESGGPTVALSGHADVASLVHDPATGKNRLHILDWKSGRLDDADHDQQMKGYGFLGSVQFKDVESVYCVVVDLRTMATRHAVEYTASSLFEWFLALVDHVSADRLPFHPGEHCGFCPRSTECVARQSQLSDCFHVVTDGSDYLAPGDPLGDRFAKIGKLHQATKEIRRLCDETEQHIRAEVAAAGGVLPVSNDRELVICQKKIQKISGGAIDHLRQVYGDEVDDAVQIGKTKLLDVVRSQAERGSKKGAAEECMEHLRDYGWLLESFRQELALRKRPEFSQGQITTKGDCDGGKS